MPLPKFIAEIGKNWWQTAEVPSTKKALERARELVKLAKESGADAVKFQTHSMDEQNPNVQIISPHFNKNRYDWIKAICEITDFHEFWIPLKEYCENLDITFFSTPMSLRAAYLLEDLDVPFWKIGSADILDFLMLDFICGTEKPIILSSGMSSIKELRKSIDYILKRQQELNYKPNLTILHCVSEYPCPLEKLNLATIGLLKEEFNLPVGFSDHSLSIEPALMALNLGAVMIEKHFTTSREHWGPDHKVSLLPHEFKEMVKRADEPIKASTEILGIKTKFINQAEAKFRPIFRKSLTAFSNIKKGDLLHPDRLSATRPQLGTPSEEYPRFIWKQAEKDYKKYDPL